MSNVADVVQDTIVESRTAWGEPWPRCPTHGTHPLAAGMRDGVATWLCREDESVAIPIGELQQG